MIHHQAKSTARLLILQLISDFVAMEFLKSVFKNFVITQQMIEIMVMCTGTLFLCGPSHARAMIIVKERCVKFQSLVSCRRM